MPQPAVNDVNLADAPGERLEAALDLGDHPGGDRAVGHQPAGLAGGERMNQAFRVVDVPQDAGDVGEDDELVGPHRRGDRGGRGIGIDVELVAVGAEGHRGNHRHLPGVGQVVDRQPIDPGHLADVAEVERLAAGPGERERLAEQHVGGEEVERHRPAAVFLEPADQLVVEFGGEDPLDDRQRRLVGVAAALHEPRLDARLVHRPADRLAPPVNHHDPHPQRRHEDDVEQQVAEGVGMLEDAPAELDHRGRVAKLANPTERLDQRVGLLDRLLLGAAGNGLAGHGQRLPGAGAVGRGSGREIDDCSRAFPAVGGLVVRGWRRAVGGDRGRGGPTTRRPGLLANRWLVGGDRVWGGLVVRGWRESGAGWPNGPPSAPARAGGLLLRRHTRNAGSRGGGPVPREPALGNRA
jgi:hypothetical protein